MTTIHLDPDGPHSDTYTRQVAGAFAETVRVLNYATRTQDGVPHPATVNSVLGDLRTGMQRMDQLLRQINQRLRDFGQGDLADSRERDVEDVVGWARVSILEALDRASSCAAHLERAFNDTSGLYLRDDQDGA
ncbi:hypothetical protein [Nonomuraea gerenzanensis]|uniref:Uncharacterized protein n=1 Tax=Nonomuraea gerenzanensis TaxID=93944 RepID=A0A1M4BKV8_9ACTN|nr:hypothetical protein [Nonomuraea gerenzanensis]UBU09993.1 hypothetical protein LCN96_37330 [Nonomuraea gerenzanensis]SAP16298.1 hypothetical protein BN4615_P10961 [Nonomuraea gerenzanensis]